jgi:NADPH:quinone reductase-like Zn-dependent oxidoreductase
MHQTKKGNQWYFGMKAHVGVDSRTSRHVSLIGASLTPSGTGLDPLLLTGRGITLSSISVGSRTDFEAMNWAIAMHGLHPVIDRTFPFAQAKEAYRHFEGRGHFGKVVISHS